jgi:hypothetical protein
VIASSRIPVSSAWLREIATRRLSVS